MTDEKPKIRTMPAVNCGEIARSDGKEDVKGLNYTAEQLLSDLMDIHDTQTEIDKLMKDEPPPPENKKKIHKLKAKGKRIKKNYKKPHKLSIKQNRRRY